ncbi:hypothetical protein KC887_01630 [Candidatus Kaiserbacteria bacterium]|nr:hypothetical protein [Candidatus Kaiserbacteria bacterium]
MTYICVEPSQRTRHFLTEAGGLLSPDWWHRRWVRTEVIRYPGYYHGLLVAGNPLAKPKRKDMNWRRNWLWTPLCLTGGLPQRIVCNDNMLRVQLRTLLPVTTRLIAVRVGPEPMRFFGVDEDGFVQVPSFYNPNHEDEQFIGSAAEIEDLLITYQAVPPPITYI